MRPPCCATADAAESDAGAWSTKAAAASAVTTSKLKTQTNFRLIVLLRGAIDGPGRGPVRARKSLQDRGLRDSLPVDFRPSGGRAAGRARAAGGRRAARARAGARGRTREARARVLAA